MTYKRKLWVNFFTLFAVFTIIVLFIQYAQEKNYKKQALEGNLLAYTAIIDNYIGSEGLEYSYKTLSALLPEELRITIIDKKGVVLFDDNDENIPITDNHIDRPEVKTARQKGVGSSVRISSSTGKEYYYLVTKYDEYFVRVALPNSVEVKNLLKGENLYIYIVISLFVAATVSLLFISDKMGRSISALRDFAISLTDGTVNKNFIFPSGELGEIGQKLVEDYRSLESSRAELKIEKDKLIKHFTYSTAGIAFFSPQMKPIYNNPLFMSHLNTIVDYHTLNAEDVFTLQEFKKSLKFIGDQKKGVYEDMINKNGHIYNLRTIVFEDGSIEVILNDVTSIEKTRVLKQEMTSNIAHELRTPISSISGYLETILNCDMPEDKRNQFIERSYSQVQRLTGLIRDISIITSIEQGNTEVEREPINVLLVVQNVLEELKADTLLRNVNIKNTIPQGVFVPGNRNLIYSIFRNLIDNAQNYAGENITLKINMFMENENYYYFSVADNGMGIDEKHLARIFDRFYRISEGRTRKTGGSGLGLSIVKNSVLFHGGTISAKRSIDGGVEVIFTLSKI